MKTRPFKMLALALTLPLLAGCSLIDNILGNVALNLVFESEFLLNRVSMTSGEADIGQFDVAPTSEDKRAVLTYGFDALATPKAVTVKQMGFTINMTFEVTFSTDAENLFYIEEMDMGEEASEEMSASMQMIYPIGTQTPPESVEQIGEWLTPARVVALKNEPAKDLSMTIKGISGTKSKSRTFYFNLNSDLNKIPGDINVDDPFIHVVEPNQATTTEVTIPMANLAAGHTVPLQIAWFSETVTPRTGHVTVTVEGLGEDYEVLDADGVVVPNNALGPFDITENNEEEIVRAVNTIRLKAVANAPTSDLVVTYHALVTVSV